MKPRLGAIRGGRQMKKFSHLPVWTMIALALLLTAGALYGVLLLSSQLDQRRTADAQAHNLNALVKSVHDSNAAATGATPGSELRAASALAQLEPMAKELSADDGGKESAALETALGTVRQTVADAEQGMLTGQLNASQAESAAANANRAVIDAAASAEQSIHQAAVNFERFFNVSILFAFVFAAIAVTGLILRLHAFRKNAVAEQERQENRHRSMLQHSGDIISLVDRNGIVQVQTSSMLRILGRSDFWLNGRAFAEIVHSEERGKLTDLIQRSVVRPGEPIVTRLRLSHGDGSWRTFEVNALNQLNQPDLGGVLLICRMVEETGQLARSMSLAPVSVQHPVSGLISEPFFRDRLQHALVRSARRADPLSLLVIELGSSEAISKLSDDARAAVMHTVAGRLVRSIRNEDTAAQLGELELAIILEDADGVRAQSVANRISEQIESPVAHLNGQVKLTSRIGIAVKSDPRENVDTLLLEARAALRGNTAIEPGGTQLIEPKPIDVVVSVIAAHDAQPKSESFTALAVAGGNVTDRLVSTSSTESQIERERSDSRPAVEQGVDPSTFDLQFIPVLALQTGEIVELEAVARWRQPQRGLVAVEASGTADSMTPWLLERACDVAQSLPLTRSGRRVRVSFNVTSASSLNEAFADCVAGMLLKSGVAPEAIQLEIPVWMLDDENPFYETTIATIRQLRKLGLGIAIDGAGIEIDQLPDFAQVPVTAINIDRSVVSLLDRSADRRARVREIVERARPYGVSVTGSGVETLEQAERLWDLGADQGQGPLFFRPVSEEQLHVLFTTESAMVAAD